MKAVYGTLIILFLFACNKPEESDTPGSVKGFVSYDVYADCCNLDSTKLITNGVVVRLQGKTHAYSTVSNKKGYYEINHVDSDTYTLSFEPKEYAAMKLYNIRHNGVEWKKVRNQFLAPLPEGRIKSTGKPFVKEIKHPDVFQKEGLNIFLPVDKTENAYNFRVFIGRDKKVSPFNYVYTCYGIFSDLNGEKPFSITIPIEKLMQSGVESGSTIFIKAYVTVIDNFEFGYRDPSTNQFFYTAVDPVGAPVITYELP